MKLLQELTKVQTAIDLYKQACKTVEENLKD